MRQPEAPLRYTLVAKNGGCGGRPVSQFHPADVADLNVQAHVAFEQGGEGGMDLLPLQERLHGQQAGDVRRVLPNAAQPVGAAVVYGVVEGIFRILRRGVLFGHVW